MEHSASSPLACELCTTAMLCAPLSMLKDALIYSTHPAWHPEGPQGVLRGTGQTGRLFKPRGAGCGPSGRHPIL